MLPLMYRRLRGSFDGQPVRPWRMRLRMAMLIAVGVSLAAVGPRSAAVLVFEIAGVAAGIGLALWSAQRTRFVSRDGRWHYVSHTYAGLAISLLVAGRIVYRSAQAYLTAGAGVAGDPAGLSPQLAPPALMQGPATAGLLCVLIGYYVCYYSRVLWKSRRLDRQDPEVPADRAAKLPTSSNQ